MNQNISCPKCSTFIDRESWADIVTVCPCCGYIVPKFKHHKNSGTDHSRFIKVSVTLAVMISALFLFTAKWGRYSWQVPILKAKTFAGMATVHDLKRMLLICKKRKQIYCVKETYAHLVRINPADRDSLDSYTDLLLKDHEYNMATVLLRDYFAKDGHNAELAFKYAKLLENQNSFNSSGYYYRLALKNTRGSKASITRSYIGMLIKAQRYRKARGMILSYRRQQKELGGLFMAPELKTISRLLAQNR